MAKNWITFRQAGMIVNALHGRDRFGRKIRKKQYNLRVDSKDEKPSIIPLLVFIFSLIFLFNLKVSLFLLAIAILVVFAKLILERNRKKCASEKAREINKSNDGLNVESFKRKSINEISLRTLRDKNRSHSESRSSLVPTAQQAKTIYEASVDLGVSMEEVRKLLLNAGIKSSGNPLINYSEFEKIKDIILNKGSKEKSAESISREFNFSKTQVSIELKKIDPCRTVSDILSDDVYDKLRKSIKERANKRDQCKKGGL